MFTEFITTSSSSPTSLSLMILRAVIITLGGSLLLFIVYLRRFSPLSNIPGPFWASISRSWLGFHVMKGDLARITPELHEKYGKLVRIAPDEVSVSDADSIKIIYGTNTGFTKTDFYDFLAPPVKTPLGGTFAQRDEKLHARRRRIINNVYSMTNVLRSEEYIDSCTKELMAVFKDYSANKRVMDLERWMKRYAYEVIGELFYGTKFGFMEVRQETEQYLQSIRRVGTILSLFGSMRSVAMLQPLIFLVPSLRTAVKALKARFVRARSLVDRRRNSPSDRMDLLSELFAIHAGNSEYTVEEIYLDSHTALAAGSSTTATVLISIFYYILKNPAVYDRLEAEIDNADAQGLLSDPIIRYSEATQLPYLNAVCKEGMRVFPPVGMTLPRYVPSGGRVICEHHFPEGYQVGINAWASHRDKDAFGDDAAIFNPDRWLQEGAKEMDRFMFQFGGGSRTCIGKNVSLCEIYKLVPQILRKFKIALANPDKEWQVGGSFFAKQSGVEIRLESRK